MLKIILVLIAVLIIPTLVYAESYSTQSTVRDDFIITTGGVNIQTIYVDLDWDFENLTGGKVHLNEPYTGEIVIHVPKNIPRIMNADFETPYFLEFYNTIGNGTINENASGPCWYRLSINLENVQDFKIKATIPDDDKNEIVSVKHQLCRDFTLQQQQEDNVPINRIMCQNDEYVLVERPNGKLACVYHNSVWDQNWTNVIKYPNPSSSIFSQNFLKENQSHTVKYQILGAAINGMHYDDDAQSFIIEMDATQYGRLYVSLPRDLIDSKMDYCPPQDKDAKDAEFFVLINGEKVDYDKVFKNDTVRTLKINFNEESNKIEIIGTCFA